MRSRQDGRHHADGVYKCIFLNENTEILNNRSENVDPEGPIENKPASVQVMASYLAGGKALSESMMASFTYVCIRRQALRS